MQVPVNSQNLMKKADFAPYGAAIDPSLLDNQFRMNSQGFFSAHSQKLIS